jgi:calcineurin-like phosphoesterase family protein
MNYYFSDTHLGHANVIRMNKRPFNNVDEMDDTILRNINSVVTNNDDLYLLGDVCYKSGRNPVEYLRNMNGKKHLIIGNHDGKILKDPECRRYFVEIEKILNIKDKLHGEEKMIVMCHYPMVEWDGFFRGSIHLYGHIHNITENQAYKILRKIDNAYNVGADILEFVPRTLDEVIIYNNKFDSIL